MHHKNYCTQTKMIYVFGFIPFTFKYYIHKRNKNLSVADVLVDSIKSMLIESTQKQLVTSVRYQSVMVARNRIMANF